MIKVLFVCYGNICRSPMAEFLFKHLVEEKGTEKDFYIESCATSTEEIGNGVHWGTRAILDRFNIDYSNKRSRQMTRNDYEKFDFIIGMDQMNKRDILRIVGQDKLGKVHLLMDFTANPKDVADPWYTRNFEQTYLDVDCGINALYDYIKNRQEKL